MHDKVNGAAMIKELRSSKVFNEVAQAIRQAALPGVRTPFSREAVQVARFHDAFGIHSLLEKQSGELSHFFAAQHLECPSAKSTHEVQRDLHEAGVAVATVFKQGRDVAKWRKQELLNPLRRQLEKLHEWNCRLDKLKPASVAAVAGDVPIATIACLVEALDWPHKELPLCLLCGFDIVGEIPATGVYPRSDPGTGATKLHSLDHAADNRALMNKMQRAGRRSEGQPASKVLTALMAVSWRYHRRR
jgi:hypothetical protein